MKRILTGIVIIIIYVCLGIQFVNSMMPDDRILSNNFCVDESDQALIIEQGKTDLWVSKVGRDGEIRDVVICKKAAREVQSRCYEINGQIYLLQMWYEGEKQQLAVYQSNEKQSSFTKAWEQEIEEDVNITDFGVYSGKIEILGVEQKTEKIVCFTVEEGQSLRSNYEVEFLPIAAYWGNGGIYILTSSREVLFLSNDGMRQEQILDHVLYFKTQLKGYFYQTVGSDSLIYQEYDTPVVYTYRNVPDVEGLGYCDSTGALVVLSTQNGNLLFSYFYDEEVRDEVTDFIYDTFIYLYKLLPQVLLYTLIYIIFIVLCNIFHHFLIEKKRLVLQTFGVLLIISAVWISLLYIYMYRMQQERMLEDSQFYANTCVKIQRENLQNALSRQELTYDSFRNEKIREVAEEILSDNTLKDTWKKLFARTEMIYGTDNIKIAFSEENPYGTKVESIYSAEVVEYIRQCNETSEEQQFKALYRGMEYVFHIVPAGNENKQLCLMIRIPVSAMTQTNADFYPFMSGMIAAWVVIISILLIFLQNRWQTITLLIGQMEKVSKGDYRLDDKKVPDNEIGDIWKSMESMCKSLQMDRYRNEGVLDYVYQFAPKHFEKLFAKESLQDIEVGETLQLTATIGVISIIDRDNLLKGKVQKQYIQYVNQLMEILFEQEGAQNAVFLQSGSNLENVKAVFSGEEVSVDDCVSYAVGCMESLLAQPENRYDSNPFILLHSSEFLCGLAGGSGQAYPFVVSMELEVLNSHVTDFRRNGVRMVITEQTRDQISRELNIRYIGYIASEDEQYRFRMYEVLDCCSLNEKSSKIRNRDEFEQALQLFYQDDFYLARSKFSEIIKECPEDGIARWYLFACETLFNRDGGRDTQHALFSRYDK